MLCAAAARAGGAHTLDVSMSEGRSTWTQRVSVTEGDQVNVVGPVPGPAGGRFTIVNGILTPSGDGGFRLEYQVEMSQHPRNDGKQVFQAQGTILLRPGEAIAVIECARSRLAIALDAPKSKPASWTAAGQENHRLTATIPGPGGLRCRAVQLLDAQLNLMETVRSRDRTERASMLNAVLSRGAAPGSVSVDFQLQHSRRGGAPIEVQNQHAVALGRPSMVQAGGAVLEVLVEGPIADRRGP
jgi:hypothetical protein